MFKYLRIVMNLDKIIHILCYNMYNYRLYIIHIHSVYMYNDMCTYQSVIGLEISKA